MGCLEQDTLLTRMREVTEVKGGTNSDRLLPLKVLWAQRYREDQKGCLEGDRVAPEGQDGACTAEDSKAGDSRRREMQMCMCMCVCVMMASTLP